MLNIFTYSHFFLIIIHVLEYTTFISILAKLFFLPSALLEFAEKNKEEDDEAGDNTKDTTGLNYIDCKLLIYSCILHNLHDIWEHHQHV